MSQTQALSLITPADLTTANGILEANAGYVKQYRSKFAKLKEEAEKAGDKLPSDLDSRISSFLQSASTAVKQMEADRKPFTQKAQEFVRLFTNEENALKNEIAPVMQAIRDKSAAIYAKEDREAREKEALALRKEQESINLLKDAEEQVRNAYADILAEDKGELLRLYSSATEKTVDEIEAFLGSGVKGTFDEARWDSITLVTTSAILSQEEIKEIHAKAMEGKLEKVKPHYTSEIVNYAIYLHGLIPERRKEIADGAKESKEAESIRAKQADIDAANQASADLRAETERSEQLRNAENEKKVAQANRTIDAPKTAESYTIEVKSRDGWMEIYKFYFAHSPEQDLGKIKGDQMKAFCEKYAKSNGTFISSDRIEYIPTYKALAVKKKTERVAA